jgi:hypothetical protein
MEGTTPEGWFMASKAAGVEPGQRRLNGTQTTGRDYSSRLVLPALSSPPS